MKKGKKLYKKETKSQIDENSKSRRRKVKKSKRRKNQEDKKTKNLKDKKFSFLPFYGFVCFSIVLSNVLLQTIRQFAGEVALLAGKRFLAGV